MGAPEPLAGAVLAEARRGGPQTRLAQAQAVGIGQGDWGAGRLVSGGFDIFESEAVFGPASVPAPPQPPPPPPPPSAAAEAVAAESEPEPEPFWTDSENYTIVCTCNIS